MNLESKIQTLTTDNLELQRNCVLLQIIQRRVVNQTAEIQLLKSNRRFLWRLIGELVDEQEKSNTNLQESKPAKESSRQGERLENACSQRFFWVYKKMSKRRVYVILHLSLFYLSF